VTGQNVESSRPPLILASASPRRRELLAQAGFTFDVIPTDIPELRKPGEDPIRFVTRLAREKAEAVATTHALTPDTLILGADTIASGGEDYRMHIWRDRPWRSVYKAEHENFVTDIVALDAQRCASASYGGEIRVHQ